MSKEALHAPYDRFHNDVFSAITPIIAALYLPKFNLLEFVGLTSTGCRGCRRSSCRCWSASRSGSAAAPRSLSSSEPTSLFGIKETVPRVFIFAFNFDPKTNADMVLTTCKFSLAV